MVRLLLGSGWSVSSGNGFQSHNGAIAANYEVPPREVEVGFNPTMVRLLQWMLLSGRTGSSSFNPTMVRLLPFAGQAPSAGQFRFNPTMVRLLQE